MKGIKLDKELTDWPKPSVLLDREISPAESSYRLCKSQGDKILPSTKSS